MSTESMKRLVEEATRFEYIPGGALKVYFRSANSLLKQAKRYKEENDLINAYKSYMRYATLVIEKLPQHTEYKKPEHKTGKQEIAKNAKLVLIEIENMKPILDDHFRRVEAEEVLKGKHAIDHSKALKNSKQLMLMQRQLEQEEQQLIDLSSINDRAVSLPINDKADVEVYKNYPTNWDLVNELKNVVPSSHPANFLVNDQKTTQHHHQEHQVNYPGISYKNQSDGYIYPASTFDKAHPQLPPKIKEEQPKLPPKPNEYFYDLSPTRISPTHSPPKSSVMSMPEPKNKYGSNEYLPEKPIKVNVPEYFAFTEGGEGLRTMILPINIYDKFIQIAALNTAKKLETCGVLCGKLSHNHFTVTSLVIPKQTATSDTCSMTNEEELLEYVEENDLLTLGWIHTHPTQTCFMSSMDLHTHSVYQLVLPEAVAIVCAPNKSPNFGIFRLTNPPGLQTVLQCERRGFHPHDSNEEIDIEISNCGHVVMEKVHLTVVDLR